MIMAGAMITRCAPEVARRDVLRVLARVAVAVTAARPAAAESEMDREKRKAPSSMMPKSGYRFSEKIMLQAWAKTR